MTIFDQALDAVSGGITGKSQKLAPSLMRKLARRGVYDPEAAFVNADRRVTQSANALRQLVRAVYGPDADLVLDNLRQAVDETGALDGDPLAGLAAEAEFYDKAAAEIQMAVDDRDRARAELDTLQASVGRGSMSCGMQMTWVAGVLEDAQEVLDKFKRAV